MNKILMLCGRETISIFDQMKHFEKGDDALDLDAKYLKCNSFLDYSQKTKIYNESAFYLLLFIYLLLEFYFIL